MSGAPLFSKSCHAAGCVINNLSIKPFGKPFWIIANADQCSIGSDTSSGKKHKTVALGMIRNDSTVGKVSRGWESGLL
ncbi:MAG: hypothetical protein Ct9H300mP11_25520 [Chloroflexota bacterium]|nr:MAG: hypothetical protein Ct9H300mP11_25520 [Chloroflexota bacterium]